MFSDSAKLGQMKIHKSDCTWSNLRSSTTASEGVLLYRRPVRAIHHR